MSGFDACYGASVVLYLAKDEHGECLKGHTRGNTKDALEHGRITSVGRQEMLPPHRLGAYYLGETFEAAAAEGIHILAELPQLVLNCRRIHYDLRPCQDPTYQFRGYQASPATEVKQNARCGGAFDRLYGILIHSVVLIIMGVDIGICAAGRSMNVAGAWLAWFLSFFFSKAAENIAPESKNKLA